MSNLVNLQSSFQDRIKTLMYFDKDGNPSSTKFWAFIASLIITIAYILATGVMYAIVWWKGKDFPTDEWAITTLTYAGILISNSIASKIIEHRTKVSLGKSNSTNGNGGSVEGPPETKV